MKHNVTVELDSDTDELVLTIPDEILKELELKIGDILEWSPAGKDTWRLTKKLD